MSPSIGRQTPEARELGNKRTALAALEVELAQRELDLVTLQADIRAFEARYFRVVGRLPSNLTNCKRARPRRGRAAHLTIRTCRNARLTREPGPLSRPTRSARRSRGRTR